MYTRAKGCRRDESEYQKRWDCVWTPSWWNGPSAHTSLFKVAQTFSVLCSPTCKTKSHSLKTANASWYSYSPMGPAQRLVHSRSTVSTWWELTIGVSPELCPRALYLLNIGLIRKDHQNPLNILKFSMQKKIDLKIKRTPVHISWKPCFGILFLLMDKIPLYLQRNTRF